MKCVHPVSVFRARGGGVSFSRHHSTGIPTTIRCGRCVACRLHKAREWAIRITHESQIQREAAPASRPDQAETCGITLTYNDDCLPENGSLRYRDFQTFIKRLRKAQSPTTLRYFACGEYGGENLRPHYHLVLFGTAFPDRYQWTTSPSGHPLYRSPSLEASWTLHGAPLGHALISDFSFDVAMYTAKYTTKVLNVSKASSESDYRAWEARYQRVNPLTGEIVQIEAERAGMSRRPGIGYRWFRKYWRDLYPNDRVIIKGTPVPVPAYYDRLLEQWATPPIPGTDRYGPPPGEPSHTFFKDLHASVKRARIDNRDRTNDGPQRLASIEACHLARQSIYSNRD